MDRYEQRLILFIDFLGFRDTIAKSVTDAALLKRVLESLDRIRALADHTEYFETQKVTQFSDCLVVSYRVDEPSAVFDIVNALGILLIYLVEDGFLLRGGITVGPLIHTDKHVLGPAMVRAYELESKCAKFPRIIIDPVVLEAAKVNPAEHHEGDEEVDYIKGYLRSDDDGLEYIDYVSFQSVVVVVGGKEDGYPEYLGQLAALIGAGLANQRADVLQKYLWLHGKYREALDGLSAALEVQGDKFPHLLPVLKLPLFDTEVSQAKAVVAAAARDKA